MHKTNIFLDSKKWSKHIPNIELECHGESWTLHFPDGWLKAHPLINAELANEIWLQHKAGWELICQ